MAGTLFVVATPIGNLEDITLRALRTLREVDLVAAEDTRRTAKLLAHYGIQRSMISLHEHNEHREAPKLVERIAAGTSVALVSDAGTPGVSDPGQLLVGLAQERGLRVVPIPGPSAIMAALSVSGRPASEFVFMGFPPHRGKARRSWIGQLANEIRTVVAFEAPHRIKKTLDELKIEVKRPIIILREATKLHEELVILPNKSVESIQNRGEFVLVLPGKSDVSVDDDASEDSWQLAVKLIGCMTINGEFETDVAIDTAARACGIEPSVARKLWKQHRIAQNRRLDRVP